MNCKGTMSFGTFLFPVNPYLIRLTRQRLTAEAAVPYGQPLVSDMGSGGCRISGEGEFCGTDSAETFLALQQYAEEGGRHVLYLPSQPPVMAVLTSLTMVGRDLEGVIQYRFVFTAVSEQGSVRAMTRQTADGHKSLWDYARESGLSVEWLKKRNPDVMRPDKPVPAGRSVYVC